MSDAENNLKDPCTELQVYRTLQDAIGCKNMQDVYRIETILAAPGVHEEIEGLQFLPWNWDVVLDTFWDDFQFQDACSSNMYDMMIFMAHVTSFSYILRNLDRWFWSLKKRWPELMFRVGNPWVFWRRCLLPVSTVIDFETGVGISA